MTRHELVLTRVAFDAAVAALESAASEASTAWLGIGHAVPDAEGAITRWRVGALRAEPFAPRSAWALRQRQAMAERPQAALLFLVLGAAGATPPASASDWHALLQTSASAYRLLCAERDPAVLVLWVGVRGHVAGASRLQREWKPLSKLSLPGPGMVEIPLQASTAWSLDVDTVGDLLDGRYSRLAGALGAETLARWQNSTFAVVGAGRTGSVLAHTLVRSGASVLLLDPDHLESHNLCGDVLPQHEGLNKADAVARYLRPLVRPGASVDARKLDIGKRAAGLLLTGCDALISCVDDDRARVWASTWACALLLPHLDIGVAARLEGDVGADLRLVVPGAGCLACVGGFAQPQRLPANTAGDRMEAAGAFHLQRAGSLRSWAQMAGHAGLRLLELMYADCVRGTVARRLLEAPDGSLQVADFSPVTVLSCVLCGRFGALGRLGIDQAAVRDAAIAIRARSPASAASF